MERDGCLSNFLGIGDVCSSRKTRRKEITAVPPPYLKISRVSVSVCDGMMNRFMV
jgi:hypothetical protein